MEGVFKTLEKQPGSLTVEPGKSPVLSGKWWLRKMAFVMVGDQRWFIIYGKDGVVGEVVAIKSDAEPILKMIEKILNAWPDDRVLIAIAKDGRIAFPAQSPLGRAMADKCLGMKKYILQGKESGLYAPAIVEYLANNTKDVLAAAAGR